MKFIRDQNKKHYIILSVTMVVFFCFGFNKKYSSPIEPQVKKTNSLPPLFGKMEEMLDVSLKELELEVAELGVPLKELELEMAELGVPLKEIEDPCCDSQKKRKDFQSKMIKHKVLNRVRTATLSSNSFAKHVNGMAEKLEASLKEIEFSIFYPDQKKPSDLQLKKQINLYFHNLIKYMAFSRDRMSVEKSYEWIESNGYVQEWKQLSDRVEWTKESHKKYEVLLKSKIFENHYFRLQRLAYAYQNKDIFNKLCQGELPLTHWINHDGHDIMDPRKCQTEPLSFQAGYKFVRYFLDEPRWLSRLDILNASVPSQDYEASSHAFLVGIMSTVPSSEKAVLEASSFLDENHSVHKLNDLDETTSWIEGVAGDGIGEWIKVSGLRLGEHGDGNLIVFKNGFGKDLDHWKDYNRVKDLNIYLEVPINDQPRRVLVGEIHLMDTPYLQVVDVWNLDEYGFPLIFEITDIYKGEKFEHTALASIFFISSIW